MEREEKRDATKDGEGGEGKKQKGRQLRLDKEHLRISDLRGSDAGRWVGAQVKGIR